MQKQNASKPEEQAQSRRDQYKKRKMQETDQIYICECGKKYLTFSALYLHARNKHNVKLTTKRNNKNSKIQTKGDKKIITYFIHQQSISQSIQISSQKQQIHQNQNHPPVESPNVKHQSIIDQYLHQRSQELTSSRVDIFRHFQNYFNTVEKEDIMGQYDPKADITLYFNQFTVFYYPRYVQRSSFMSAPLINVELALKDFYNWLKEKNITKSVVVYSPNRSSSLPIL